MIYVLILAILQLDLRPVDAHDRGGSVLLWSTEGEV